jgi:hypothetical protein
MTRMTQMTRMAQMTRMTQMTQMGTDPTADLSADDADGGGPDSGFERG